MSDLTAQHYLDIYRMRLKMADEGTTHPRPEVVAGARRLVAGLSAMQPEEKVRLQIRAGRALFIAAATHEVVGEIVIDEGAEPDGAGNSHRASQ